MLKPTYKPVLYILFFVVFFIQTPVVEAENLPNILSADEAFVRQHSGQLVIIDIRHMSEWLETGIPKGAKPITMHNPDGPLAFLRNITSAVGEDKNAAIALICASGARSNWAQKFLLANGFSNISNISEGMLGRGPHPGWVAKKLPLEIYQSE